MSRWVTPAGKRKGLLVAVISGGRPTLAERPTGNWLGIFEEFKPAGVVWVVSDKDAELYERDEHELALYPREWALDYASDHWMLPSPPASDGFLGAFPGREWACREAERRGCWGVLQLDDNIIDLRLPRGSASAARIARQHGGLGLYADLLSAMTLSTNGRMVGANLNSVAQDRPVLIRQGFPYSLFVEQVGEGREEWFGPYEDDITHAFQYGNRADGVTSAVMPSLRYMKESKSKTGMRTKYDHMRSVQLQRIFPESTKVMIKTQRSNGRGGPRIFHKMKADAIKNPVIVQDRKLFNAAKCKLESLVTEWHGLHMQATAEKVRKRVEAGA